ncbi:MAG: helix-turn-helix domain-containing protein [Lachnospiraceae bacterium]|nr:helix-turn-helix domain-containing protein [Lachnospiraceae bacterium]
MNISEKIFYLRTAASCSQEALADALGVSRQTVSKWELGNALPDTDRIIAMSRFFKVSTDFLLIEEYGLESLSGLDRIAIRFANSANCMKEIADELVAIAGDGKIDKNERERLNALKGTIEGIEAAVKEVKKLIEV